VRSLVAALLCIPLVVAAEPALAQAAGSHAGHAMPAPSGTPAGSDSHEGHAQTVSPTAAPAIGADDHAADRVYGKAAMDAARRRLFDEHGDHAFSMLFLETLEYRPHSDGDGYGWEGQYWWGGDINRLVLKSQGEGTGREGLEQAEAQALYSRAIGPYFNLQAGVRQDFARGPDRTYGVLGVEGLAPYWFEVSAHAFVSDKGDLTARLEGAYDLRLTQRLILEPRAELDLAAQDVRELGVGSGLSTGEFGLRLRYAIRPEFAPYVGVLHEAKFGRTADLARGAGLDVRSTRVVLGLRAWF